MDLWNPHGHRMPVHVDIWIKYSIGPRDGPFGPRDGPFGPRDNVLAIEYLQ